jgi:hypothetical protein
LNVCFALSATSALGREETVAQWSPFWKGPLYSEVAEQSFYGAIDPLQSIAKVAPFKKDLVQPALNGAVTA